MTSLRERLIAALQGADWTGSETEEEFADRFMPIIETEISKQAETSKDLKAMRERLAARTARVVAHGTTSPSSSGNPPKEVLAP